MKRKRYTEEQIISILKEHEAGATVVTLARRQAKGPKRPGKQLTQLSFVSLWSFWSFCFSLHP